MGGQDSFLDIVSNIVGILIILVMIAGVRAQNSAGDQAAPTKQYVEKTQIAALEQEYDAFREKESQARRVKYDVENIKLEAALYEEQMARQAVEHAQLFDAMTSARAALEIAAEEKDQEKNAALKEQMETQRQIQATETKLQQIRHTKEWIAQNRPKTTVLENIPTPISKTINEEEKEAHFRLLGGRISYVPINEFRGALDINFAQNKDAYFKKDLSEGRLGPIEDWNCEFLISRYDVPVRGPWHGNCLNHNTSVVNLPPFCCLRAKKRAR